MWFDMALPIHLATRATTPPNNESCEEVEHVSLVMCKALSGRSRKTEGS